MVESVRWFASLTMTVGFIGLTMTRRAAAKSHVILTGGRDRAAWHGGVSELCDAGASCCNFAA
jgi:hypothetical protein